MILNNRPVLVNKHGQWTVHEYVVSEMTTLRSETGETTGIAHNFRCTLTGEIRRYGFDAPYMHGEKDVTRHA